MKHLITLIAILISSSVYSQSKDTTIIWYGMPFYDTLPDGRIKMKTIVYKFDHIPTRYESLYVRKVNTSLYKKLPTVKKKKIKK
jgi:hypothetical protein